MYKRWLMIVSMIILLTVVSGCWPRVMYTISGQVIDQDNQGMAGVSIQVTVKPEDVGVAPYVLSTTTDSTGAWQAKVDPGLVKASATKDQWVFTGNYEQGASSVTRFDFIGAPEGVMHFPDPNFEAGVRWNLQKPEGDIMVSDMLKIDRFGTMGMNVSSIEGIQYLLYASFIDLSYNQITDISPLLKLKKNLSQLILNGNTIKNLDILQQIDIIDLLCEDCHLSNLDFINNMDLKMFFVGKNQISDISPLKNQVHIDYLRLNANNISDISALANLKNVETLDLSVNQIEDISVIKNLRKLQYLYLDANQISNISVLLKLPNLCMVSLKNNPKLDLSPGSSAWNVIMKLKERKVEVDY